MLTEEDKSSEDPSNEDARSSEVEATRRRVEALTRQASFGVIDTMTLVLDALDVVHGNGAPYTASLSQVMADMQAFLNDQQSVIITARARVPRERDVVRPVPGQHNGVWLYLQNPPFGLGINIYGGGIREFVEADIRDRDVSLRRSHTTRTDNVVSQVMEVNAHLNDLNRGVKVWDLWIRNLPKRSFMLSTLIHDNETFEPNVKITPENYGPYDQLEGPLKTHIRTLTTLIPSAV